MDTIERSRAPRAATTGRVPGSEAGAVRPLAGVAQPVRARADAIGWLRHDLPYIVLLLLALVGVVFRLPVTYWVILTPVFGIISIAEGWRHFAGRTERLGLVCRVALVWCALLLAIYLLDSAGVQGVMNANASSLAMMTLLALGTFVAGLQAHVWRMCAVGGVLFLAVPGLGWLDQSPLLLTAVTGVIILLGGLAWWLTTGGARLPASAQGLSAKPS